MINDFNINHNDQNTNDSSCKQEYNNTKNMSMIYYALTIIMDNQKQLTFSYVESVPFCSVNNHTLKPVCQSKWHIGG